MSTGVITARQQRRITDARAIERVADETEIFGARRLRFSDIGCAVLLQLSNASVYNHWTIVMTV
jgi:hypothetical protein